MRRAPLLAFCALSAVLLSGCSSSPVRGGDSAPKHVPVDPWAVVEPVPRQEARSRYGNPDSYEVFGKRYHVLDSAEGYKARGIASWYGSKFHGRRTSSGEPYDMFAISAAHKTLPLPCFVRVTNLENGKSLIVRVNDRGPFHPGRIIDLSYTAAIRLGVYANGSAQVEVETLTPNSRSQTASAAVPEPITTAAPQAVQLPPDDAINRLIANLPQPQSQSQNALPFLRIAAFRKISDCTALQDTLARDRVMALQVLEQADNCLVLQGPFATVEDAKTQTHALRALGHTPVIYYP